MLCYITTIEWQHRGYLHGKSFETCYSISFGISINVGVLCSWVTPRMIHLKVYGVIPGKIEKQHAEIKLPTSKALLVYLIYEIMDKKLCLFMFKKNILEIFDENYIYLVLWTKILLSFEIISCMFHPQYRYMQDEERGAVAVQSSPVWRESLRACPAVLTSLDWFKDMFDSLYFGDITRNYNPKNRSRMSK